jgi:putative iron-regulated protein
MKKTLIAASLVGLTFAACNKDDDNTNPPTEPDFNTLKTEVLADFTNKVAVASYTDLDAASQTLYNSIDALNSNTTDANLATAQQSWKDMRAIWEKCEGFLFGPVDENSYDPNMDTWPTDYSQMDSLLASSSTLTVADIQTTTLSLRGYHPIEYILFGQNGNRTAASITDRQKEYIKSLATDLRNTCSSLHSDWTQGEDMYSQKVITAGNGSTVFAKKQEAYITILEGMIGICEEVGEGKMKEPFDTQNKDIVESPYSGNSKIDFQNNIIGAQNVYLGKYKEDGRGLNELVALKNKALDQKIQNELAAAIASFDNITMDYEDAISQQQLQVQATMDALATLKTTLDTELRDFILLNIQD